jgi:hypothetical protein
VVLLDPIRIVDNLHQPIEAERFLKLATALL